MLITGGSGGIGKEAAKVHSLFQPARQRTHTFTHLPRQVLLSKNATVYIAARNSTTGEQAVKELMQATGKAPIFLQVDLADLKSIKAAAQEFKR